MATQPFELTISQFDHSLQQIQKASEILGDTWRQVFNKPFKNIFRKLDFRLYSEITTEALNQIHLVRGELALIDAKELVFKVLDRHAHVLESFGHQLLVCLEKLANKAAGNRYSYTTYTRDMDELDRLRELLIESQQNLNLAIRSFISQFDPADIPDFRPQ